MIEEYILKLYMQLKVQKWEFQILIELKPELYFFVLERKNQIQIFCLVTGDTIQILRFFKGLVSGYLDQRRYCVNIPA